MLGLEFPKKKNKYFLNICYLSWPHREMKYLPADIDQGDVLLETFVGLDQITWKNPLVFSLLTQK